MRRKDLASDTGLSYPYISEIENGVKVPSEKALRNIAEALQIDYAELVVYGEGLREMTLESDASLAAPSALDGPPDGGRGDETTMSLSSETLARSSSPSIRRLAASRRRSAVLPRPMERVDGGLATTGLSPSVDQQAVADLVRQGVREEMGMWVSEVLPSLVSQVVEQVIEQMLESEGPAE